MSKIKVRAKPSKNITTITVEQLTNIDGEPWHYQKEFLNELNQIMEHSQTKVDKYKGKVRCHACSDFVNMTDFTYDEFKWPLSIHHFVAEHNARVPEDFYNFVMLFNADSDCSDDDDGDDDDCPTYKPKVTMREGFFACEPYEALPMAVPNKRKWAGQAKFVEALKRVEAKLPDSRPIKGWYSCTLCTMRNVGAKTFRKDYWEWREGLEHYVTEHNVRPSLAFQEFIMGKHIKD